MSDNMNSCEFSCPETKQKLRLTSIEEAEQLISGGVPLISRPNHEKATPFGRTATVMLREDHECAYPVVDGIPILLTPEMLFAPDRPRQFDLTHRYWAEAYEEMDHYNRVATEEVKSVATSASAKCLEAASKSTELERDSFPEPPKIWIDSAAEASAQLNALRHMGKVRGKRFLQLGGKGIHAVKFLLAGAEETFLISPMFGEVKYSLALARHFGVESRLRCVVGIGEQMPFADATFHGVFSGGCIHHTVTETALPEIARILQPGGKFAAVDPWRTPIYQMGITIFGKREKGVFCKPITKERAKPLFSSMAEAKLDHHGALSRYPLILLEKAGFRTSLSAAHRIQALDDAISSLLPPWRHSMGSCVVMLGTRG